MNPGLLDFSIDAITITPANTITMTNTRPSTCGALSLLWDEAAGLRL